MKKQLTVQVDEKTFREVERRAKLEDRPVAQWLRAIIRAAITPKAVSR